MEISDTPARDERPATGPPGNAATGAAATAGSRTPRRDHSLPPFSHRLNEWFMWYVRGYLQRHFHALRLLTDGSAIPAPGDRAVFIYTNHPGWWDPLVFLMVGRLLFPGRMSYGPIDQAALGRYRFMERIGFIGIDPASRAGAARFLRAARAASVRSDVIFWCTAQGEFVDPRSRPLRLRPGIAHAAAAGGHGWILPLAVEYPFWSERLPEALVAFGTPLELGADRDVHAWQERLQTALTATQDRLAAAACRRDARLFRTLLSGRVGVGGPYDVWRGLMARLRGERFDPAHLAEPVAGDPP